MYAGIFSVWLLVFFVLLEAVQSRENKWRKEENKKSILKFTYRLPVAFPMKISMVPTEYKFMLKVSITLSGPSSNVFYFFYFFFPLYLSYFLCAFASGAK